MGGAVSYQELGAIRRHCGVPSRVMAPATGTALLVLVTFVLPGFVAVLLKERIYEVRGEESTFDRLLTTVYYSLLIYLLPGVAIAVLAAFGSIERADLEDFFNARSPLWVIGLVAIMVLLLLPAAAALAAWGWVRSDWRLVWLARLKVKRTHRVPTSWDFAFDHEQDLLLVVTLRDGARVAGYYGRRSHSGYGTRTRDLYLEERWDFTDDGDQLERPAPGTLGVWINAGDIVAVEQYALSDEQLTEIAERSS
jgi:Family of unknown function (DUF6338)